jgi:hypothetical protein
MSTPTLYIGGPLTGLVAEQIGEHWDHYRDDGGKPMPAELGDADMYSQPVRERRYYYLASLPDGGLGYVHLTLFDHYLGAGAWKASYGEAVHRVMDL